MRTHDVIVVGGSLAGAACVRELTRQGLDAIAFERDHFPRPKVCGGFISPGGVECLERLGVLDRVLSAGATVVHLARIRVDSTEVEIPFERSGSGSRAPFSIKSLPKALWLNRVVSLARHAD
jgi:2-polyprenyl-6-methoxyphenol hydroxylase-like FAD-dependent oxidoreductase